MTHRALIMVVVLVTLLATLLSSAIAGQPSSTPSPSASAASRPLDDAAMIELLARAGIATYADEDSPTPVVSQGGSEVMAITSWQARNLAREVRAMGGMAGADLDRAIVLGDTGLPFSYLLAAWITGSPSEGAAVVREAMGDHDWTRASELIYPTSALLLFGAEAAQAALATGDTVPAVTDAEATSTVTAMRRPGSDARVGPALQLAGSPLDAACTTITGFVDRALSTVFNALRIDPRTFGADVPGQLLGFLTGLWNRAIDLAEGIVRAAIRQLTAPVVNVLRTAIGVAVTLSQVISYLKPWHITVQASPDALMVPFSAPGAEGRFRIMADVSAQTEQWPRVLRDCAQALDVRLPELAAAGAPVDWQVLGTTTPLVTVQAAGPPFRTELGADRTSTLRYLTIVDPPEYADGPLLYDMVWATVSVERREVSELTTLLERFTIGQLPPEVQSVVRLTLGPQIDALLADARNTLAPLLNARGMSDRVIIAHHGPPSPTPPPTPEPTPTPRAAVWVHLDRPADERVEAGRILELVACDGPYGEWRGFLRTGGLLPTAADPFEVPWAELPVGFTVPGATGRQTVLTSATGTVVTPIASVTVTFRMEVVVDGRTMSVRKLNAPEVDWPAAFEALPIQPAPAGRCGG